MTSPVPDMPCVLIAAVLPAKSHLPVCSCRKIDCIRHVHVARRLLRTEQTFRRHLPAGRQAGTEISAGVALPASDCSCAPFRLTNAIPARNSMKKTKAKAAFISVFLQLWVLRFIRTHSWCCKCSALRDSATFSAWNLIKCRHRK